ncbi:hypothetical protein CSB07_01990 [Candidatus Gracilibacteria bacterium]|nr:MAG: hypothetical protein CSB07_01990 [Candidatus Gracilibacteria bacterium]
MKNTNLFTIITKFLVIILPFYVIISLFLTNILHIPMAGFFIKEFALVLLFGSLAFEYIKDKKIPKFDLLDYLVFSFILYGVIITFANGLGLKSIIFGGRYDFMFLVVMLIFKNSGNYLKISLKKLLELFLYSGFFAILLSSIFKFAIGEKYLLNFGFVNYSGSWIYSGGVPNYHGLEATGIKRFQGIFDGPNPMAYFLIIYSFIFLYMQKNKKEYYVFLSLAVLFWFLILTYSRSALLGVFSSIGLIFLLDFKRLFKKYKKTLSILVFLALIFSLVFGYIFRDSFKNIILRHGSTSGHFERMEIGLKRFAKKPLGAGLAEAGPAFRSIYPDKQTKKDEVYYIPESWYIQILIEGGIIYFLLFLAILLLILKGLFFESKIIFSMFLAILVMNVFLHIFESTYLSILLFIFIGLFLKKE